MFSCQRCKGTSNGPRAFLLTCRGCCKTWHHRCHMPPVEDDDLIQRIRATNTGDKDNSLAAWICRRCKKAVSSTPVPAQPRDATPTQFISPQIPDARQTSSGASVTPTEDDVEMEPTSIGSTSLTTSSPSPPSDNQVIRPNPLADVRGVSSNKEPGRQVRPAGEAIVQSQQEAMIDDDSDDLYGPPVERHIVRILPSLAEELRAQQRRAATNQERRRAPLAPDWILARHAQDPLWKEIPAKRRRQRKASARQLVGNGLNVNELMDCWVWHKN